VLVLLRRGIKQVSDAGALGSPYLRIYVVKAPLRHKKYRLENALVVAGDRVKQRGEYNNTGRRVHLHSGKQHTHIRRRQRVLMRGQQQLNCYIDKVVGTRSILIPCTLAGVIGQSAKEDETLRSKCRTQWHESIPSGDLSWGVPKDKSWRKS